MVGQLASKDLRAHSHPKVHHIPVLGLLAHRCNHLYRLALNRNLKLSLTTLVFYIDVLPEAFPFGISIHGQGALCLWVYPGERVTLSYCGTEGLPALHFCGGLSNGYCPNANAPACQKMTAKRQRAQRGASGCLPFCAL